MKVLLVLLTLVAAGCAHPGAVSQVFTETDSQADVTEDTVPSSTELPEVDVNRWGFPPAYILPLEKVEGPVKYRDA